jgi:hypothetical protein
LAAGAILFNDRKRGSSSWINMEGIRLRLDRFTICKFPQSRPSVAVRTHEG